MMIMNFSNAHDLSKNSSKLPWNAGHKDQVSLHPEA